MTAALAAISDDQHIRCECGQVLAVRWERSLRILAWDAQMDERGRWVLVCPVCKTRRRVARDDETRYYAK